MQELYWITRLDGLETFFGIFTALAVIGMVVYVICRLIYSDDTGTVDDGDRKIIKTGYNIARWFALFGLIAIPGCVFVPNTKEAMIIYGVGGAMDYLQANPAARQLPDNIIDGLNRFAQDYIERDEQEAAENRRK